MQEFLLALLVEEARYESLNSILDRIETFSGGSISSEFAVEAIREDRDTMIVVDASVLVPAVADDGPVGARRRARLRDARSPRPWPCRS